MQLSSFLIYIRLVKKSYTTKIFCNLRVCDAQVRCIFPFKKQITKFSVKYDMSLIHRKLKSVPYPIAAKSCVSGV